jgi:hypothetical protein
MTSHETSTTSPLTTSGRRPHTTRRHARRTSELRASAKAPVLGSAGRFLALVANPFRAANRLVGGLLTAALAGGIWVFLTLAVVPTQKHLSVQTPVGPHAVTEHISRWPGAVALACVIGTVLILIAGIRLQLMRDRSA